MLHQHSSRSPEDTVTCRNHMPCLHTLNQVGNYSPSLSSSATAGNYSLIKVKDCSMMRKGQTATRASAGLSLINQSISTVTLKDGHHYEEHICMLMSPRESYSVFTNWGFNILKQAALLALDRQLQDIYTHYLAKSSHISKSRNIQRKKFRSRRAVERQGCEKQMGQAGSSAFFPLLAGTHTHWRQGYNLSCFFVCPHRLSLYLYLTLSRFHVKSFSLHIGLEEDP